MYFAYLDEFGHDGPFVSREHPRYRTSPVFGLAGFVMPADNVPHFGSWVFQNKCRLFQWEIDRAQKLAWEWEKKGARLLTLAAQSMYGLPDQRRRLIEQPFQLESERYQNLQAADWIAGLIGRLGGTLDKSL